MSRMKLIIIISCQSQGNIYIVTQSMIQMQTTVRTETRCLVHLFIQSNHKCASCLNVLYFNIFYMIPKCITVYDVVCGRFTVNFVLALKAIQ